MNVAVSELAASDLANMLLNDASVKYASVKRHSYTIQPKYSVASNTMPKY